MADVINPKPGEIDEKSGFRTYSKADLEKARDSAKLTKADEYRATQRGYAFDPDSKAGVLVEEGEPVPANIPVSEEWMEKIKGSKRAVEAAVDEALEAKPKDVDLTKLNVAALQALAAERGINAEQDGTPLSKADLITAINAARANDAG